MDPRVAYLRECALFLRECRGGDREAECIERSTHAALELAAELLERCGAPPAHGYKDACDKMVEFAGVARDLAEKLKRIFDVGDRMPIAWSSVDRGQLDAARRDGGDALARFADEAERVLGAPAPAPAPL